MKLFSYEEKLEFIKAVSNAMDGERCSENCYGISNRVFGNNKPERTCDACPLKSCPADNMYNISKRAKKYLSKIEKLEAIDQL